MLVSVELGFRRKLTDFSNSFVYYIYKLQSSQSNDWQKTMPAHWKMCMSPDSEIVLVYAYCEIVSLYMVLLMFCQVFGSRILG